MKRLVLLVPLLLASSAAADHVRDLDRDAPYACAGGKDCIPAIDDPSYGSGAWLEDGDRVVGVVVEGTALAYPVRILDWHEIVNDRVGDVPFTVTYCPLCGTALVFDGRFDDRVLTFGVSGRLFHNDLVMYDRETDSLWSQVLGEAIWGPLHGRALDLMPSATTTWGEWRAAHPDTKALDRPADRSESLYERYPYGSYETDGDTLQPRKVEDDRLHPKTWVYGIALPEGEVAFLLDALRAEKEASVALGASVLEVRWSEEGAPKAKVVRAGEGASEVAGVTGFWFAWLDFHPTTLLWPGNASEVARDPPVAPGSTGKATPVGILPVLAAGGVATALAVRARLRRR